jgi:hypothetical protein
MNKRVLLFPLTFWFVMCDFGPTPLKLGEGAPVNADSALTVPLNVTKAFSPTGYFYNVWAPADTSFTQVDPEKWNNFLAYQSVFQHPACRDRVPMDSLVKYDTTAVKWMGPVRFYSDFQCSQFTYAPAAEDDLYGGVFWLRGNNFGDRAGVKVAEGAKVIKFWARSLSGIQTVKFGAGVNNSSVLKPWYYFSPYVDDWGFPGTKVAQFDRKMIFNPETNKQVDSVYVKDSLPEGSSVYDLYNITDKWKLYTLDLGVLYAFNFHPDTVKTGPDAGKIDTIPYASVPAHRMIGAFYWAIDAAFITNYNQVTEPIRLPDGTTKTAKFGSATILIDGIRYE